ncbi:ribonuclease T2 family protein [Methylobacterium sp. sgz302541]|uniref:ribonuclease T2 family protein n=1 Tax=unclassified Methylobacterium TaxID=2615210 RepID=UPI003D32A61B
MTTRRPSRLGALAGLLLLASPAMAQDEGGFGRGAPGVFDFYVLALSWSPTYCETASRRDDRQCAPGRGLGFVLHGLWPQYARGFPSNCSAFERPITRQAMEVAGQVYPAEGLARYEWRKHGTCSGLDPAAYFSAARNARAAIAIPDAFKKPTTDARFAATDIVRQFVAANEGLRADMMAVACTGNALQEVRICFTKDLRGFTPCPEVVRRSCRSQDITVDAAR